MTGSDRVFFTMELVRGTDFTSYVRGPEARRDSMRPPLPPRPPACPVRGSLRPTARSWRWTARRRLRRSPTRRAPSERPSPTSIACARAMRQLVEGVASLHAARKLHRDIKPSNVLVTPEGRVVILDFGVATEVSRVVDEEMRDDNEGAVGTAAYMAPEQAFEEPTSASDWYAVGVMLYEAIVGRTPFSGSVFEVLTMKTSVDPLAPSECVEDVPAELDALCRALLHREPAMRPTGAEILQRLGVVAVPRAAQPTSGTMATSAGALPAALAGRESHLRALHGAFEATLDGRTMTIRVGGRSGMGKSAVVHRFLDELVGRGSAVVLRGRAYEREAVPYKAVDGVVDALSRYLMCLTDGGSHRRAAEGHVGARASVPGASPGARHRGPARGAGHRPAACPASRVPGPARALLVARAPPPARRLRGRRAVGRHRQRRAASRAHPAAHGAADPPRDDLSRGRGAYEPVLAGAGCPLAEPCRGPRPPRGPAGARSRRGGSRCRSSSPGDAAEATAEAIARESGGNPLLVEELARNVASQAKIPAHGAAMAAPRIPRADGDAIASSGSRTTRGALLGDRCRQRAPGPDRPGHGGLRRARGAREGDLALARAALRSSGPSRRARGAGDRPQPRPRRGRRADPRGAGS